MAVSEHDIETFAREGVVCLRAVLDLAWIDRLRTAVPEAATHSADMSAMAGAVEAGRGRFIAGTDHWRTNPTFRSFALESPLPALVGALVGASSIVLYEDSLLVKEPDTTERTVWHQDLGYFHLEGSQIATTWCPLDATTEASGAIRYVAGSHRWGRLFRPNLFVSDDVIPGTDGEDVPDVDATVDATEIVTFDSEPGDVIVHHAATLHAAGPNRSSSRGRRAVSVRYCGDEATVLVRPGAPLKPQQRAWRTGQGVSTIAGDDFPVAWSRADVSTSDTP